MFSVIVYICTDQPMELERFLLFSLMGISLGLCSQGLGYTIGSFCNILVGSMAYHLILLMQ